MFLCQKSEITDKWPDLRKENYLHSILFIISEEYREDLLHGINKGHKQQMKIQHTALIITCSIQTFTLLSCAMIRGTVVLQEGMNSCWWAQSTIPMFEFSCAGDDETDSCLYQFEGLGKAHVSARLKSKFTLHDVFQAWAASLVCQGFGVLGSSSKLSESFQIKAEILLTGS